MKCKVTVPIATPGHCYVPGPEYEFSDAEGDRLIHAGQAVAVDANYKPKPIAAPAPKTLDQKPGVTAEQIAAVKLPPATPPAVPTAPIVPPQPAAAVIATGEHGKGDAGPNQTEASVQTAVDAAKRGGK